MTRILKIPLYFFGFLIVGLIFAYFTFKLLSFSRTVDVPDLSGKNPVEANEMLSKRGLYLKIEGEDYDPSVETGNVLRQDVPPGSRVKEQRSIKVILSKGPKVRSVPSVVGQPLDKAELLFLQAGLKIGRVIRVHSNSTEKDRVIAQRPAPDEMIAEKVTLVVSAGPYDAIYYCPEFLGKTLDEASAIAEKLGLKLNVTGVGDMVKSQKPRPGAQIKTGDTVEIQLEAHMPVAPATVSP